MNGRYMTLEWLNSNRMRNKKNNNQAVTRKHQFVYRHWNNGKRCYQNWGKQCSCKAHSSRKQMESSAWKENVQATLAPCKANTTLRPHKENKEKLQVSCSLGLNIEIGKSKQQSGGGGSTCLRQMLFSQLRQVRDTPEHSPVREIKESELEPCSWDDFIVKLWKKTAI